MTLEYIEAIYSVSEYVSQLCAYAESNRECMITVAVPRVDTIKRLAKVKGIEGELSDLCKNEDIKKEILEDFKKIADSKKLAFFEYMQGIVLVPESFTQLNGLITATFKLRRKEIAKKYIDEIESVYAGIKLNWTH